MGEPGGGQSAAVAHMDVFQDSKAVGDIEGAVVVALNHWVAFALGSTHLPGIVHSRHLIVALVRVVQKTLWMGLQQLML